MFICLKKKNVEASGKRENGVQPCQFL